jgi:hypothetical protein
MNKKIKNISRAIPLAVALGVILIAALAITSAQAEPPPITIDCTFYRVALGRGYSQVKVAPKDMAWLKPGDEPANSEFDPDNQRNIGFVVLGRGIGPLTASTDLRKLTVGAGGVRITERTPSIIKYLITARRCTFNFCA